MYRRCGGFGDAPGIVATMPLLPPSACGATQTYIPPGGTFTSGPSAGFVTQTGACQDAAAVPAPSLPAGFIPGMAWYVIIPVGVLAFWLFSGEHR
jgi:hypothetical protein